MSTAPSLRQISLARRARMIDATAIGSLRLGRPVIPMEVEMLDDLAAVGGMVLRDARETERSHT